MQEIEIRQLNLRYAPTRIERPKQSLALMDSIERIGQIVPVVVIKEGMTLMDGYLRVSALMRLRRDTVIVEVRDCKEEDALAALLSHGRKWDVWEEAALLTELKDRNFSEERIAAMVGHTQAWVSTRLTLYRSLPEESVRLIRTGSVSAWTAMRVIAPIARAMPEHGKVLTEKVSAMSPSTREMAQFFHHYKKANRKQRDHMVHHPALFLASLHAKDEASRAGALRGGPEGRWYKNLRIITHMLKGLIKEVPMLFAGVGNLDRRALLTAFEDGRRELMELEKEIGRYDYRGDETGYFEPQRAGSPRPADREDTAHIPEHGEERDPGKADAKEAVSP